jgi:WbqC-like protein family
MRVAIMQPTYLPWSGYFGLMQQVDLFIYLDNVQFSRRSWQQRNQIKSASGPIWLTVPVNKKGKREQLISEIEIDFSTAFNISHQKSIQACYSKAKYFKEYSPKLFEWYGAQDNLLANVNISLISCIKEALQISTKLMRASELQVSGVKDSLLASICSEVGATEYISPPGSYDYLNGSNAFKKAAIPISYLKYSHPIYHQMHADFLPYMSCVDLLFNCGDESTKIILSSCALEKYPSL